MLKSRHCSYEHGEEAGKILAHQLSQNKLLLPSLLFWTLYFGTTWRHICLDNFFHNLDIPRVDLELAAELEEDISLEKVIKAIRSMQSGTSPGPDGYPSHRFCYHLMQRRPLIGWSGITFSILGFGQKFISWSKILYFSPMAAVRF